MRRSDSRNGAFKLDDGVNLPELSGKTAVSPAEKSKVRELPEPIKTVARPSPSWKYSHSSALEALAFYLRPRCRSYSWVPMQLTETSWLEYDKSSSNRC